jgi:hypothetical protein
MANYQYTSDLLGDMLFRAGEPTDGTGDYVDAALRYLNRAYQSIWLGGSELDPGINEDWLWLRSTDPGIITLRPSYSGGYTAVTHNDATYSLGVDGTDPGSALPIDSLVGSDILDGWFFKADDHADVFRFDTSNYTLLSPGPPYFTVDGEFDSVYTGSTDAAAGYKIFRLEYDLASDVLRLLSPMRVYQDNRIKIHGMSVEVMHNQWPLSTPLAGVPSGFAMVGDQKVMFSHYAGDASTDRIRIEYDYLKKPSILANTTNEEPLIPIQYRKVLADYGLFFLFMDKNDNRADATGMMARATLRAMTVENRKRMSAITSNFGRIITRQAERPEYISPLRTESGLIIG